jgi:hypothetical protein
MTKTSLWRDCCYEFEAFVIRIWLEFRASLFGFFPRSASNAALTNLSSRLLGRQITTRSRKLFTFDCNKVNHPLARLWRTSLEALRARKGMRS